MNIKKIKSNTKDLLKENDKSSVYVYLLLRLLIIVCMVREVMHGNFENVMLCILSLLLLLLPFFVEKKLKIELPNILEIIILLFIFSAEILGEINNFYGNIPYWDTILHTLNGFLCASIGFSLIYLLNENSDSINMSPAFVGLVSFCFSMTVGVAWEMFEYGMDTVFGLDMQKDEYVYDIRTVTMDPKQNNNVISYKNIEYTIIYDENNNELTKIDNYLDIGLNDTMMDLIVNFIGALVFSVLGFL